MRQIDKIRSNIHVELSLSKDLVKDVLSFTDANLLKAFSLGDKIEVTGLGLFSVREGKRKKILRDYKKQLERAKKAQQEGKESKGYQDFLNLEDLEYNINLLENVLIPHELNTKHNGGDKEQH